MRTSSGSIYCCSPALHSLTRCFALAALLLFTISLVGRGVDAAETLPESRDLAAGELLKRADLPPLVFAWGPAPSPEDGPPLSAHALRNKAYLPAQIGGIVGAYALSLVLVAIVLINLSKRRREHIQAGDEFEYYIEDEDGELILVPSTFQLQDSIVPYPLKSPCAFETPLSPTLVGSNPSSYPGCGEQLQCDENGNYPQFSSNNPYLNSAAAASSLHGPRFDPSVDPSVVLADHAMAQAQLEQMYKYVMEQDEAKQAGVVLSDPPTPLSPESGHNTNSGGNSPSKSFQSHRGLPANPQTSQHQPTQSVQSTTSSNVLQKKPSSGTLLSRSSHREPKGKPMSLNLSLGDRSGDDHLQQPQQQPRTQSRTSSIFSALKSPRRKKTAAQAMSISSPIMTPMSGTFPRGGPPGSFMGGGGGGINDFGEEMNAIPPRYYAPAAPPPVPVLVPAQTQMNYVNPNIRRSAAVAPLTPPDLSPLSIDQRLEAPPASSAPYANTAASKVNPLAQHRDRDRDLEEVSEEESSSSKNSHRFQDARETREATDREDEVEAGASSSGEEFMQTATERSADHQSQFGHDSDASSQRTRRTERTERSAARTERSVRTDRSEALRVRSEATARSEATTERRGRSRPTPERLHMPTNSQASRVSAATFASDAGREPMSAVTQNSQAPLIVGLPTSPKPGARFSGLPASPRAGGFGGLASPRGETFGSLNSPGLATPTGFTFAQAPVNAGLGRANAPSAVRTGGALPLRAYEPSLASPSFVSHQTKQTVFERAGPLSPGGMNTPWTGAPVPYTPYQPFSPVVPMTPSLVTRADRKRMRRLEPKTPTMEMVRSIDETW